MTLLNGGLTEAKRIPAMNHAEFVEHFLGHVTADERQTVTEFPPAQTFEQLVCLIVTIRGRRRQTLPPGHPLARPEVSVA